MESEETYRVSFAFQFFFKYIFYFLFSIAVIAELYFNNRRQVDFVLLRKGCLKTYIKRKEKLMIPTEGDKAVSLYWNMNTKKSKLYTYSRLQILVSLTLFSKNRMTELQK